jgi:hypothetical protein
MADLRALFATPGANLGGRYRVERELGCGKRAMVLGATLLDNQASRRALRFWLADGQRAAAGTARFWQRAQAIDLFRDPHVVEVFDVGEVEGVSYMATEWLAGRSLTRVLERSGTLSWSMARELLWPCFTSLAAAHGGGVVHGRFAPGNIFVCGVDPRGPRTARITGWEWGSVASTSEPADGTQLYLAPEVRKGFQATSRSDVYGLAAVLHRALVGEAPCEVIQSAHQEEVLNAHKTLQSSATPTVPQSVLTAIERALAEEPHERHASVSELMEDLKQEREARAWSTGLADARWVKPVSDAERELSRRSHNERFDRHKREGALATGALVRVVCAVAATAAVGYGAYTLLWGPTEAVRRLDTPLVAADEPAAPPSTELSAVRQIELLPRAQAQAPAFELSAPDLETQEVAPPPPLPAAAPHARPTQVQRPTPRPAPAPALPPPSPPAPEEQSKPNSAHVPYGQMRLL